jgi:hypothetical protein
MPSLSEFKTDPEREAAYRRGYSHGLSAAIAGLAHRLPVKDRKEIDDWFRVRLVKWAFDASQSQLKPPDFPPLA